MRFIAAFVILGTAVLLGVMWFKPECQGGQIATNENTCAGLPGFDRAFCSKAFLHQDDAIYRAGNVFQTQSDCQARHPVCITFPGITGWTPKPHGFCLVRGTGDTVAQMTPVYRFNQ